MPFMLRDYEKVMKAAADPTRARILKMLEGGEMCVCQVIAVLGLSQSTVSKHLSLLKDAGLVFERRDKKFINYSIEPGPPSGMARIFLGNLRGWMGNDPMVVRDREQAAAARRMVKSMASLRDPSACPARGKRSVPKRKARGRPGELEDDHRWNR
jgi:ArsR family transcriptional regulator